MEALITKNAPKQCVVDGRGKGEGANYEKRAQVGVFLVFLGRKRNEHVRHAHMGMSYVFSRMWEVGVVLGMKNSPAFFMSWEVE